MEKVHGRWDFEQEACFPDSIGPEGTLVEVRIAISLAVGTEVLEAGEALRAGAAG